MRLTGPMTCGGLVAICLTYASASVAQDAAPLAASPAAASQDAAIDAWIMAASRDDAPTPPEDPLMSAPRRIHGEVGAAVGSGGYRSAYGSVWVPFGQASSLTVSGADEQWKSRRWGGGERRSLALGLFLDGGDVARFFDRRHRCNPHPWAVDLKDDPVINPDGTCERRPSAQR